MKLIKTVRRKSEMVIQAGGRGWLARLSTVTSRAQRARHLVLHQLQTACRILVAALGLAIETLWTVTGDRTGVLS